MLCRSVLALLLQCTSLFALAEVLTDPTRPPAEISAPPGTVISAGNALQTVIISPGRRAAIIDGQTVELGAKHGDVRLIEVTESGVVLEGSQGRQKLALFPGVEIKTTPAVPPAKQKERGAGRKAHAPAGVAGKKEEK